MGCEFQVSKFYLKISLWEEKQQNYFKDFCPHTYRAEIVEIIELIFGRKDVFIIYILAKPEWPNRLITELCTVGVVVAQLQ